VPAYPTCGRDFRGMAHDLLDTSWGAGAVDELADFIACVPFRGPHSDTNRCLRAFGRSRAGCGGHHGHWFGKTECFLHPLSPRSCGIRRGARLPLEIRTGTVEPLHDGW
jgi:hypothetical protein